MCSNISQDNSRLPRVTPGIVLCPIPLVPAHLLHTIFCPEGTANLILTNKKT